MKRFTLSLVLMLAVFAAISHAQVGVYGKFDALRFSGTEGTGSATSTWLYGPGAGIYYDFLHLGPVALGADVRGNFLFGSQQRYRSGLFGLRLEARPPVISIRPYVQGSVGVGGAKSTAASLYQSNYNNKFQYQVAGGVDLPIVSHIDLRPIELSYGRMTGISGGTVTTPTNLFTISAGLVVRLP